MYVVALNGSTHENGNVAYLLNRILENIKGAETKLIHAAKAIEELKNPFCVSCATPCPKVCFAGTAVEDAFEEMKRADVILVGSPVYFGGPSAQIKAFFDKGRAYRGEKAFVGKYGSAISCGASKYGGQEATVNALQNIMLVQGMSILGPGSHAVDAGHLGVCASQPASEDAFAESRCLSLAARILELAK
ncbi:MAG: flavodoxin family protein [Clostridia bacterium]|nr:flavodoxin family protein [Oscillospiraceae bacterium]MBQ7032214.1 flavodoxin family protein [Clostridia bacterium]